MMRYCRYLILLGIVGLLVGCNCYRMGDPAKDSLPFCKLYVKPVSNGTYVAQAQAGLTEQLINTLQRSGVCITQYEAEADATLCVHLAKYNKSATTTQKNDTELASSFNIELVARCTLIDNCNGCIYFCDREVSAAINAQADFSVQQVIYQDMPTLTQKLANNIRNVVVSTW